MWTRCNREVIQSQIKIIDCRICRNNSIWIWSEFENFHSFLSIFPTDNTLDFAVYLFPVFFSFPFWFFQKGKHENWNLSWFLKLQKWTKLWFVHNGYSFLPSITDLLHLEILFLVIPLCLLQLFSLLQSKIIALPSKNSAKLFVFLVFFCGPPVHFLQNIFCLVAKWLTTRM